jgi:hypothetical protein
MCISEKPHQNGRIDFRLGFANKYRHHPNIKTKAVFRSILDPSYHIISSSVRRKWYTARLQV